MRVETEIRTELASGGDPDLIVGELLMSPEGRADPYPRYRFLRERAPVHRSELGMWIVSRYDDCAAVLKDPRFNKDYARQNDSRIGPHWRDHVSLTDGERYMVNLDGAQHERLRRLVAKTFTTRTVAALRPKIESTVTGLLDPVAEAGGGNLLEALAFPLALSVIGEMLGVPETDQHQFPRLVRDILAVFETRPSDEQLATADSAQLQFRSYFQSLIADKRRAPKDDLLSELIGMEDEGDRLADEELWALATLLFGAGFETTAHQICNGMLAILDHPAELAKLRADPALCHKLPDELLRYEGTAQLTVRVATADVSIGDALIRNGETVLVLLGAANRDPARFTAPDSLNVTRPNVRPLSFGGGVHFCLGAVLARTEVEIVSSMLLARFHSLELRGGRPRFRDRLTLRGLESLDVSCLSGAASSVARLS
jgi:cytochrome P450